VRLHAGIAPACREALSPAGGTMARTIPWLGGAPRARRVESKSRMRPKPKLARARRRDQRIASSWSVQIRLFDGWRPSAYYFAARWEAERLRDSYMEDPDFIEALRVMRAQHPVNAHWDVQRDGPVLRPRK
jgi:hypothetical protein